MNTTSISLYSLGFSDRRTYMYALLFTVGNIIFPQLCHLIPNGGHIFLPIYFFTLIAAYKFGWKTGLITALLSPVVNSLFFGMPAVAALPVIMIKSATLACAAATVASKTGRVSVAATAIAVVACQLIGGIAEAILTADITAPLQDITIGLPGLLIQIFAAPALVKAIK